MPHVIDPRFRDRLVTLMKNANISAKALATEVPMQCSYLSEIINGRKMPSEDMARKIDQALNAGGRLANLVGIATLAGDREHLADAVVFPHRISGTTVDALSRILNAQRYLEDSVGAAAVIGPVPPQLDSIATMARNARGTIRLVRAQVQVQRDDSVLAARLVVKQAINPYGINNQPGRGVPSALGRTGTVTDGPSGTCGDGGIRRERACRRTRPACGPGSSGA